MLLALVQVFLGALDLASVGLVGVLGTLAVSGVQSRTVTGGTIGTVLQFLHLAHQPVQNQVAVLAALTGFLFLGRTAASIFLTRRALHFLGVRAAEASSDLIGLLLRQPITYLQMRTSQDFIYATTMSVSALVLGVLGSIVVMAADASMLLAVSAVLVFVSPIVAAAAGLLLGALVLALHRLTTGRAYGLGSDSAQLDVASRDVLTEAITTYREMQVRGTRAFYGAKIRALRLRAAHISAEFAFLPNVSKYVLESAVILGALLIGALEFALEDAQKAVGVLALFLAAGTRLAPAIIRLQQGATSLRGNLGQGQPALALLDDLGATVDQQGGAGEIRSAVSEFRPAIRVSGVCYTYPASSRPAVANLNMQIEPGQLTAFVGPSGSGKSTAADLLLGVLTPQTGTLLVSDRSPREAIAEWPGAIAYVPQEVWIAEGSIRKNVALGFDVGEVPEESIWQALEIAQLTDVVRNLPDGLDSRVGERGAKLSGGQRQRLGIARAMLTSPRLVVMDEATSSLDADTEHKISEALHALKGQVTMVVIAHRLAVVRQADQVFYFEAGEVVASGSFDEVRRDVSNFDKQASLLGL